MSTIPVSAAQAADLAAAGIAQVVAALDFLAASGQGADVRSALLIAEGASRRIDASTTRAIAVGRRDGVFFAAGYRSDVSALSDLLHWDRGEAKRRIAVADATAAQVSISGETTPPRWEATAAAFAAGEISRRHVEVIVAAFSSPAARRIPAEDLVTAERFLAEQAPMYSPHQLATIATDLITTLDQDGPEPDERAVSVNELRIRRHRDGGGTITGRFDDAALFGDILAVIDAKSAPCGAHDERSTEQRQADALHEMCAFVLAHDQQPVEAGGRRPQVTVTIELADLEGRARRALLDTGDRLTPAQVRRMCCDADVVPVVLDGEGQPVDVGRRQRVVSAPLRKAVAARDQGCAHPGCDRPPSWCEVHHLIPWEHGGPTAIDNLVMLCRHHHRAVHHDGWEIVLMPGGRPVFRPPAWVDPARTPLAVWSARAVCVQDQRRSSPGSTSSGPITASDTQRSSSK